jgi:hypothetical protein
MKSKGFKLLLVILGIPFLCVIGLSQVQTGTLKGIVIDQEGSPLPGVTVTITSPSLQGEQSFVSTDDGDFRFPVLPPGKYNIKTELTGFQKKETKGIIISVGSTTTVEIQMQMSAMEEEITVTAAAPIVDVESTNLSVKMTKDLIANIPMRRDILDIYQSAPATVGEDPANRYRKSASVQGGAIHESKISLDGVDLVDPQRGYISADIAYDAIDEVEIGLGGHKAEVGQVAAGYVNVVSKSGGNKLSGGITLLGRTIDLTQNVIPQEQIEAAGLRTPIYYDYVFDSGLYLGGPIIKDKIWFFISPRYGDRKQPTMFIPFTDPDGIYHGPYDYRRQEYAFLGKLTSQITENLKWTGMYQYTLFDDHPSAWAQNDPYQPWEIEHEWEDSSHTVSQQLTFIFDQNTFAQAHLGYVNRYLNCEMHDSEGPDYRIGAYDLGTNYQWGSVQVFGEEIYRRIMLDIGGNLTRFQDNFLGMNHEFKGGIEYARGTTSSQRTRPQPYTLYWRDWQPWAYYNTEPYKGRIRIRIPQINRDEMPRENGFWRIGAFLQDSITIKNRLSLNIGFRYDESHGFQPEAFLKGWYDNFFNGLANTILPEMFPTEDITVPAMDDIIVYKKLSPRIGMNYDLFGDGKTSLKASFSRYAEILIGWNLESFHPFRGRSIDITWYDDDHDAYFDLPPIDRYSVWSYSPYITDPEELRKQVDSDLSSPYTDEFMMGITHELVENFSISLNFIYKEAKNLVAEDNLVNPRDSDVWVPYTVKDPGADGEFGSNDDQDLTVFMKKKEAEPDIYQKRNVSDAFRKYWGLDLILFKRMTNNWQLSSSITYSKTWGNYPHRYGAVTGGTDWYDPNDFINRVGRLSFDRPLIVKLMSTVVLPYGINLSAYFRHLSGSPWGRNLTVYFPDSVQGFQPKSPTVTVKAEPVGTRRTLPETYLDLRIEKEFNVGLGTLSIWAEAFNVFGFYSFDFEMDPGGYIYSDGSFARYPKYGDVNSARGSRYVNFALRFTF